MIPSKFTISQETMQKLNAHPLSPKRKREIRFEGIKRLIESEYAGYKFSVADLVKAAGYRFNSTTDSQYSSGSQFILNLIKKGAIVRHEGRGRQKSAYSTTNASLHGRPPRGRNIVRSTLDELSTIKDPDLEKIIDSSRDPLDQNLDEAVIEFNKKTIETKEDKNCYSFSFTLEKRGVVENGKQTMTSIQLNDVTLAKTKDTLQYLINNFENIA